jgi:hypothetical protein
MNHPQATPNSKPKPWLGIKAPISTEREDDDDDKTN